MQIKRFLQPRSLGASLAAALVIGVLQLSGTAHADTAPPVPNDPTNPQTSSVDPLPTVQIDGVVWSQKVVGNTVYVGGDFTTARPAGAAPGVNTVPRSNLLAYDVRTGVLIDSWAPTANAEVHVITASPDGSRIYVGGNFTSINGQTKNRIVALNPTTGAIIQTFAAVSDASVRAIVATSDTVYLGGLTTSLNGAARSRAGAVSAEDGSLLPWAPVAAGGTVDALALTPDGSKMVIGGSFTTLNGSNNPGYGLGAVDPVSGASLPWAANSVVRNGGDNCGITSLAVDSDSIYASGYTFGRDCGTLEGTARMNFDGTLQWVEDCHGDTYSTYPRDGALYAVGHMHYCGNVPGGFHQSEPWSYFYGLAFSKPATGTLKTEYFGYTNFAGTPVAVDSPLVPQTHHGNLHRTEPGRLEHRRQ